MKLGPINLEKCINMGLLEFAYERGDKKRVKPFKEYWLNGSYRGQFVSGIGRLIEIDSAILEG